MQISHLGHSCVLVEAAGVRLLIDPGNFSQRWHGLGDLDAVVVTHQHPDHLDPDHVPALLEANPDAVVLLEPEAHQRWGSGEAFPGGAERRVGEVRVSAVGGQHALIHADIPRIGNVGVVVEADGKRFFHPGDCLTEAPADVDVVAIPVYGPWAAMKETIDFVRAVDASDGFGIHEGLLNERGWQLAADRTGELTSTRFHDLRDAQPREF